MLNSFLAIGRLSRDAELTITRNGDPMLRFTIAVERNRKDAAEPDWIPCAIFGERARLLAPYLTKGVQIGISGRLESFKNDQSRSLLRVNVFEVNFLSRPKTGEPAIEPEVIEASEAIPTDLEEPTAGPEAE